MESLTTDTNNHEGGGPPLSPPYWQTRLRSDSSLSSNPATNQKRRSGTIRLEDHDEESAEQYRAVWAKSVSIDDFSVVGAGVGPAIGSYVVWNCTVETLNVSAYAVTEPIVKLDALHKKLSAARANEWMVAKHRVRSFHLASPDLN
jgi:hypothetical protein